MNAIIGHKIRDLRESKNLTQEQVAEFIHVSQSTYARIESGTTSSWAGYIEPLCKLFEIQPEELLKNDSIVINNHNSQSQYSGNGYIINNLSEKLIEQYEKRLEEKDALIKELKEKVKRLNKVKDKGFVKV